MNIQFGAQYNLSRPSARANVSGLLPSAEDTARVANAFKKSLERQNASGPDSQRAVLVLTSRADELKQAGLEQTGWDSTQTLDIPELKDRDVILTQDDVAQFYSDKAVFDGLGLTQEYIEGLKDNGITLNPQQALSDIL